MIAYGENKIEWDLRKFNLEDRKQYRLVVYGNDGQQYELNFKYNYYETR